MTAFFQMKTPIGNADKYRGDIIGKAKRRKQMSPSSSRGHVARTGRVGSTYRWPNGRIPYQLSSSYSSRERAIIARAMQSYHDRTCIRFVRRTNEQDYLKIGKYGGSVCFSDVGRSGGEQMLSLDDGCVIYRTVIHELMHSVGFWHEHERPDRDSYTMIARQPGMTSVMGTSTDFSPSDLRKINKMYNCFDGGDGGGTYQCVTNPSLVYR
ncbi:Astacin domain containing protein [Trichuris trichiura]|uniref:Metalloendopeptidase n=1 Tax=Trichuris trichiura TaxID=36087 RepID=A0A077Z2K1_TRITR|nr:Astacin domain containing protein [Trichuris trichiura]